MEEAIGQLNAEESPVDLDLGLKIFDFSQNVVELWLGSNISARREILDLLCLNRRLSDVSLELVKRKPFDEIAKRPQIDFSRRDSDHVEPLLSICLAGIVNADSQVLQVQRPASMLDCVQLMLTV